MIAVRAVTMPMMTEQVKIIINSERGTRKGTHVGTVTIYSVVERETPFFEVVNKRPEVDDER